MSTPAQRIAKYTFLEMKAHIAKMQACIESAILAFEEMKKARIENTGIIMYPQYIILHYSRTKDGKTVSWDDMKVYHVVNKGWKNIGYHFGIELIDTQFIVLVGRMMTESGAHAPQQGMNRKSLGICFVGTYDQIEPPKEMLEIGHNLIISLMHVFDIPLENVVGHREVAQDGRSCPGKAFSMTVLRETLKEKLAGG